MIWIWLLVILFAIVMVATGIILCLPYSRSPEKRWRDTMLRAYQTAQRQAMAEQAEVQRLRNKQRAEKKALVQEAFARFLASISVNELEAYPGIGPATVDRLKQAGYKNLAKLQNAWIRIHGLGEKRLADVNSALRQLTRQAESRFRAGACQDSHELEIQLQQLGAKYAELECRAQARAKGAAEVVRQLDKPVALARQVTFWKYFWKDAQVLVPPELLHRALPDLRNAVTTAEQQALKAFRIRKATGNSRSESKSRTVAPIADALAVLDVVPVAPSVPDRKPSSAPVGVPAPVKAQITPFPHVNSGPSALRRAQVTPPPEAQAHADTDQELVQATIEFAFAVARSDGRITRKEKTLIEEHLQRQYASDPALLNRVKAYCAHYETAAIKVDDCLQRIREWSPVEERAHLLEFACRIADACGPMNQREVQFLQRVSREWDVPWQPPADTATPEPPEAAAAATVPQWPFTISDPRALLEIDAAVPLTTDLIRRHYHLLSSRLTPERAEAMGPEFVALAQSKCQAIRAAAEELLQPFGEPLEPADAPAQSAELRYNPDLDAMFGA